MKKVSNLIILFPLILSGCSSPFTIVKKTIPIYFDEKTSFDCEVSFFNNNYEIPYIDIQSSVKNHLVGNEYSCKQENNIYTLTNLKNQSTMTIDISSGEVTVPEINKFRMESIRENGNYIDEFYYDGTDKKTPPIKQERVAEKCVYNQTETYKFNLKEFGFAPILYENKGYLPINVLPLITSYDSGTYYLCDDDIIYNIRESNSSLLKYLTPKTYYSKSYYEYSFNIFSLSVELFYGLKGYSKEMVCDGSTFNYLPNGVLKEFAPYKDNIINSQSLEKFDEAINTLINTKLLDGGHSTVNGRSFGEEKKGYLPYDKETQFKGNIDKVLEQNRKNSPDADDFKHFVSLYDTDDDGKNDIGYLTLPSFSIKDEEKTTSIQTIMRGDKSNKGANDLLNPNSSGYDSNTNNIKDVIIDLTLNNGGSVIGEGFLLSWLCNGYATQTLRCNKNHTYSTFTYKFDVNGDDNFTKDDYLPDDINVYILSSRTVYSAANSLVYDSYLYNRDAKPKRPIILMGEKTAGGSCSIIDNLFLPTGLRYQLSACDISIDPKNVSICCESGVSPNAEYTIDRNKLAIRTGKDGINAFVRAKHPLN